MQILYACAFVFSGERVFIVFILFIIYSFIDYSNGFLMSEDSEPLVSSTWKSDAGKLRNLN